MYEEVRYEKPFLTQVVARLDFAGPLSRIEKGLPDKLIVALSHLFPIIEPAADAIFQELKLQLGVPAEEKQTKFKQWNFFGKEREKQLTISSRFAFIAYTKYLNFEILRDEFALMVRALGEVCPDARVSRFGLRYINNIAAYGIDPQTAWNEYLSPALLSSISFFSAEKLTRLVHIAEMKPDDTIGLRFQFGMPNPDYPAVMKRPDYVLDIDAFVQTVHELPTSLQYLEQSHEHIQHLFENSITDKLRERMNAGARARVQE
jgi:uncharacterized protein (TIGR04255 family)